MDYYVEPALLASPPARFAAFAPFQPPPKTGGATEFFIGRENSIDLFRVAKGGGALTSRSDLAANIDKFATALPEQNSSAAEPATAKVQPETTELASQRIQLMAAKYAGGGDSVEIMARLEILNNRMLDQAPLVSVQQVELLEAAQEKIVNNQSARNDLARRLQELLG